LHQPLVLDYDEVGALSLDLMQLLESEGVPRGMAIGALLLSAIRIISPKAPLEVDEEIMFTTETLEWLALRVMPVEEAKH
jgi:hypothetical protein